MHVQRFRSNVDNEQVPGSYPDDPQLPDQRFDVRERPSTPQHGQREVNRLPHLVNQVEIIAANLGRALIEEVVDAYERERSLLSDSAMPSQSVMDRLMRYQTSLDRRFSKALGELLHVIDRRKRTKKRLSPVRA